MNFQVLRQFEDGSIEAKLGNGVVTRQTPFNCALCGKPTIEHGLNGKSARLSALRQCEDCFDVAELAKREAKRRRLNTRQTPAERRYIAIVQASPVWRDKEKIATIYAQAALLTKQTGLKHEVDHIYPIQSAFACGLHVHQNLQILGKSQNRSKKNRFPLFDSPALGDFRGDISCV